MSGVSIAFDIFVYLAAWSVTTVFAWVLLFAIVVMPGFAKLDDGAHLRAFQVVDGIIQTNQPIFVGIWMGSVLATLVALILGFVLYFVEDSLEDHKLVILTVAIVAYWAMQATTFTRNIPLNNRVKTLDIFTMDEATRKEERNRFEGPWNFWNNLRTVIMGGTSLCLMYIVLDNK